MPSTVAITAKQVTSAVSTAIAAAMAQQGVAYRWGGESLSEGGFDCSGLVQYAFGKAGVKLPRTAADQQKATTPVSTPVPGDLVFYGSPATHVGIYLGAGKMIAAPKPGDVVKIQSVYGRPANYGRVTGSVDAGTTGQEPRNNWAKYLEVGAIAAMPGLDAATKTNVIGAIGTGGGVLDAASAAAAGTVSIATSVAKAGAWMSNPHNWARVGLVGVGGVMILVGVSIVAKPVAAPVADAAGAVVTKLPAGRAIKSAADPAPWRRIPVSAS